MFSNVFILMLETIQVLQGAINNTVDGKCIIPDHPENGIYQINGLQDLAPGTPVDNVYINVTCLPGYERVGDDVIYCYEGSWSYTDAPTCTDMGYHNQSIGDENEGKCIIPDHPENGLYQINGLQDLAPGTPVNAVYINVTCLPGYERVGDDVIFCYQGSWSYTTVPTCSETSNLNQSLAIENGESKCIIPEHPENGLYQINGLQDMAPGTPVDVVYINVTCLPGYERVGDDVIYCYQGSWSYTTVPTCSETSHLNQSLANENDEGKCRIPQDLENGLYKINGPPNLAAGMIVDTVYINVTCLPGYKLVGDDIIHCYYGYWSFLNAPKCLRACKLERTVSLEYLCFLNSTNITRVCDDWELEGTVIQPKCMGPTYYSESSLTSMMCANGAWNYTPECLTGACKVEPIISVEYICLSNSTNITRACNNYELDGTIIQPKCVRPIYYSETPLTNMLCNNGAWNYTPECLPECGFMTPKGVPYIIDGFVTDRGDFPWHAAIYFSTGNVHTLICGGSIISDSIVLSAAHCFWNEAKSVKRNKSYYTVGVGQLYREWDNPHDNLYAQRSDVKELVLPHNFYGARLSYQHDIAIVVVKKRFSYETYIRPICIDFRQHFYDEQVQKNNLGKVAGWGLTTGYKGSEAHRLMTIDMPFVPYSDCIRLAQRSFAEFIVADKICAGYGNGTGLCRGDSGGGLVFPMDDNGMQRFYIRGIVSASPPSEDEKLCNIHSVTSFTEVIQHSTLIGKYLNKFYCSNGRRIPVTKHCDGANDCGDGSDETLETCGGKICPTYFFRCAYGACADKGSTCNGIYDCVDGSDESEKLCGRKKYSSNSTAPIAGGNCILPPYPTHGTYSVSGAPDARPGDSFDSVVLNISCLSDYGVEEQRNVMNCTDGDWSGDFPRCVHLCKLNKHPSVTYNCLLTSSIDGSRECSLYEPVGTVVRPKCKEPEYFYSGVLPIMRCTEFGWDQVIICTADCGRIPPIGSWPLMGGWNSLKGELPWHAGIYEKIDSTFKQKCVGSIISTAKVLSAAHCFWDDASKTLSPLDNYRVAVGKLFQAWDQSLDRNVQKSIVSEVIIPPSFRGSETNYKDDIAVVIVATPFVYRYYIRPVCIDLGNQTATKLYEGNYGKFGGWSLKTEGYVSRWNFAGPTLRVLQLNYFWKSQCTLEAPPGLKEYITEDKICAHLPYGTSLCHGDVGGGLSYPETDNGVKRYYLHGVISGPPFDDTCSPHPTSLLTKLKAHERFLNNYI